MPSIDIRVAGPTDAHILLPMIARYHRYEGIRMSDSARRAAIAPLLDDDALGRIWLVQRAGEVVGYAILCFGYSVEFGGRDAFLDELFIEEHARGKGLGRETLCAVVSAARAGGIVAVHLEVNSANRRAQRLYSALGFKARRRFHLMSLTLVDPGP